MYCNISLNVGLYWLFRAFYAKGIISLAIINNGQTVNVDIKLYRSGSTPSPQGECGDVNNDNSIDIVDALLVAQYYVGLNPLNFDINNADTNCDGNVDIIDALLIAQYYVSLITEFC